MAATSSMSVGNTEGVLTLEMDRRRLIARWSASSMPKNLRRPVRINIMSAARSQPDRIGPLCPIPNQSSPPFYHRLGGCTL